MKKKSLVTVTILVLSLFIGMNVYVVSANPTPFLKIDVSGYHLTAGAKNTISISITNIGEADAHNVTAYLTVPQTVSGIAIVDEPHSYWETLEKTKNIHPKLYVSSNTPLGAYSLQLTLEYNDSWSNDYTNTIQVGVIVDSVEPTERTKIVFQGFQITPTNIYPGEEFIIDIELANLGANAYDIQTNLVINPLTPLVSLDPTLAFLGDLESDQNTEISYNLRVNGEATAQTYTFQLTTSFYDVYNQLTSITETIAVTVHSSIDFRLINIQPVNLAAEPGETVTIEADLFLIGTETVRFVQIEIVEDQSTSPFLSVTESYEYIGQVDPDSPIPFDIQFSTDPNATPGTYKLSIKVSYWNEYNQERQTMTDLPVTIQKLTVDNNTGQTNSSPWNVFWNAIRTLLGITP